MSVKVASFYIFNHSKTKLLPKKAILRMNAGFMYLHE